MYVRSLVFQSGQSLLRYCSQACSKIQKYLPAESFTTHGEAIDAPNTEVMYVFALQPRLIPKAADPTPWNNAPLLYSCFEKGCRKKCTRQSRKVLWVVCRSLVFKEISKNVTRGQENKKSRFDSYSVRNKCIGHIPYYLSGLSRAQFLRQPF